MQNSKTSLSVIIVNYRSEQYLEKCLASLFKYLTGLDFEVIVVNNDEKDALGKIEKKFPEIKLINHQKNIGFGAGCNLGSKIAQGEILWFLNPDTEIVSPEIKNIFDKLKESEKLAVIGPRLLTKEGKTQEWCAGKESTLWRNIKNNLGIIESKKIWESDKPMLVDWVSGATMAIKKEKFDLVGGFDEKFFMYFEDEDLCKRIKERDFQVMYYPKVSVVHLGGKSRENLLKQKKQFLRSFFCYLAKRKKNV